MPDRDLEELMKEARTIIRDIGLTEKMFGNTPVYVFLIPCVNNWCYINDQPPLSSPPMGGKEGGRRFGGIEPRY